MNFVQKDLILFETYYKKLPIVSSNEAMRFIDS